MMKLLLHVYISIVVLNIYYHQAWVECSTKKMAPNICTGGNNVSVGK